MSSVSLPEEVRVACAWVAGRARFVQVDEERIDAYAQALREVAAAGSDPSPAEDAEAAAAYAICMNAINFGSGWWPTVRKRAGHSGYATMAAGLSERFDTAGPWSPEELVELDAAAVAEVLGQDPEHPLMAQFAETLSDVGRHLLADHEGRYLNPVEASASIPELAATFATWEAFADTSLYEERPVPFFKRAQLASADLQRAGVAALPGVERLTAFADNLVPHVLRVDGVLRLDPTLLARIEGEELLEHGSPQEVELRACAVHALELLAGATARPPAELDNALWNRGREARYKAMPRPRCRNTAY